MKGIKNTALFFLFVSFFIGCTKTQGVKEQHERPTHSVTLWTKKTELFMEYPALVVGQKSAFITHLTNLADFKPITEGKLTMNFKGKRGEIYRVVAETPIRAGIFKPTATFAKAGRYTLEMVLESPQVSDLIRIDDVTVHPDMEAAETIEEGDDVGLITFLKEQQWKIDFCTESVREHHLKRTVQAVGEIQPKLQYHAQVASPVEGIILAEQNHVIPVPGSEVKKGQILASISPPLNAEGGWTALKLAYDQARIEYERAQRLYEKMAISEKHYQETRREYETRKSSYEILVGEMGGTESGNVNVDVNHFHLKAPISGIVAEVSFVPGQKVSAGQKMFTIINPTKVWLSVKVPEKDVHLIAGAGGAFFQPIGSESTYILDSSNSTLLSISDIIDPETRTVKVIFEVDNPERALKVGQFVRVALHTEDDLRDIAVPESAIYDEGGWYAVFVQREGEAFEKRKVETGVVFQGVVQITDGLSPGERVVTVGGYQVKLASMTAEVGHGHTH